MSNDVKIGVFGGSGFYSLLDNAEKIKVDTPFGPTSDLITVGKIEGKKVAFLPRHGEKHTLPPHKIPYKANLWAMKQLGVERIIGPCAAGSLQAYVKIGDFVISDQIVNKTFRREDTFYDGPVVTHISFADPYCPELRNLAIESLKKFGFPYHETGTVVVIEGPRFSTRAESKYYSFQGWEVINMTQYPESVLARELEMCYVNIALITDYDVGMQGKVPPVSHEHVIKVFQENNEKLKTLIFEMIKNMPKERHCDCKHALSGARFE